MRAARRRGATAGTLLLGGQPVGRVPLPAVAAYLKRLVSSVAAYQLADVVSRVIAVLLLPVYTRYIAPAGYGVVEILSTGVILLSILARLGIIEAFLRFYFTDEDPERRDALARRAAGFLLVASTLVAVVLAVAAGPLSRLVLSYRDATTFRIAVLGLWSFTNLELAYGLLRVDERLRLYATASVSNVLLTVAASVVLVVGEHDGARGAAAGQLRRLDVRAARPVVSPARPAGAPAGAAPSGCRSCCASGCRPSPPRPPSTC